MSLPQAIAALGLGELDEAGLRRHVWPLFAHVLDRPRGEISLANHSLGRPLDRSAQGLAEAVDAWYAELGGAWGAWLAARERFRALVARLIGAARADGRFHIDDIAARVVRGVDLVVLSHAMFRTSQLIEAVEPLARQAHDAGARLLLDVHQLKVDFAVGGSCKYLRGGPGAAWLYVRPELLEAGLATLDTGWFANREPFACLRPEPPQAGAGGDAWLESTPAVLGFAQARAGLELAIGIEVGRLRAYSLVQQARLISLLAAEGIDALGARRDHGAFVVVAHPRAGELASALASRGITVDARGEHLRLCPDILNSL